MTYHRDRKTSALAVNPLRVAFWLSCWLLLCGPLASAQTPDPARAEALQREAQGQVVEAEQAWQTLLKSDPKNAEALAHLGVLASRQEHYPQAIDFYSRALEIAPQMPGVELNLGLAYFKNAQFAQALKPFADQLKLRPNDPQLTLLLGMTHYAMGDYLVAIPFLKRGAEQQAGNFPLLLTLAHSCLWSKQLDCVMQTYKQILVLNPGSAEAEMLAGEALDESGDDAGAITHFKAAAEANPKEPNVHFGLGYLLWTQSHYAEAAPEFSAEIANDPQHAQAHAFLADCLVQMDKFKEAEGETVAAIKLDPQSEIAHRDLGLVDAGMGKNAEAEVELRRALSLNPADTAARYRLARVLQALGKRDEAAAEFRTVSSMKKQQNDALLKAMPASQNPSASGSR